MLGIFLRITLIGTTWMFSPGCEPARLGDRRCGEPEPSAPGAGPPRDGWLRRLWRGPVSM